MSKTKEMVFCGMFTALIAVGAFIKVPIPMVPFTLQTFFVMMAAILLGSKWGSLSAVLYLVLGLIGLPIFAEGGGFWYVLKPSFGYIIGFCIGSFVAGWMTERMKKPTVFQLFGANLAGLGIIYLMGMVYFYIIGNFVINQPIGLWLLVLHCFLLVAPGDLALSVLAAVLGKKLRPVMRREGIAAYADRGEEREGSHGSYSSQS